MADSPAAAPRPSFHDPQVNLYVQDVERSLRFYGEVLGFAETFRYPSQGAPAHVELALGPLKLGLASFATLEQAHGIRTGPGPARGEVALFTADVDGAYGWAVAHGAVSLKAPSEFGGYIRNARVGDPDGNPVVFTTRLPVTAAVTPEVRPEFRNHLFNVFARTLEDPLRFYRDTLGLSETFRAPSEGPPEHVELELGPLNLSVSTLEALERNHGIRAGGGPPRFELVLWVEDVDGADRWFRAAGAPSLSPPHDFAGRLRAAWIADPEGNPVQVVSRQRGR